MVHCDKAGCVLKIFNKGFDFKKSSTARTRGSVRGTKCSRSAIFGTCLKKRFSLDITEELVMQAKEGRSVHTAPVPQVSSE